jgi:hypothetical protein
MRHASSSSVRVTRVPAPQCGPLSHRTRVLAAEGVAPTMRSPCIGHLDVAPVLLLLFELLLC